MNPSVPPTSGPPLRGSGSAPSGLTPIAYHEAGHVVVGYLLGLQLLDTDILADDDGGRGHAHFAHPGRWFKPERGPLTAREKDLIERVLTTFMAGLAAESRYGEPDAEGSGYDLDESLREWVSYVAETAQDRDAALRGFLERATGIVQRSDAWEAVEAVAAALLREERLRGAAAAQIVVDALGGLRVSPHAGLAHDWSVQADASHGNERP